MGIDFLSTLGIPGIDWSAPRLVSAATTLTVGRHHVCSGTSADYTVTLPPVAGNAGRFLSVEMAGALTKRVTLDGNASETIDDELTRIMWKRETALLFCDGVRWTKQAGKSIPMTGKLVPNADQLTTAGADTIVTLGSAAYVSFMDMTATANALTCVRPNTYDIHGQVEFGDTNATAGNRAVSLVNSGTYVANTFGHQNASVRGTVSERIRLALAVGNAVKLSANFAAGSYTTTSFNWGTNSTFLEMIEIPSW